MSGKSPTVEVLEAILPRYVAPETVRVTGQTRLHATDLRHVPPPPFAALSKQTPLDDAMDEIIRACLRIKARTVATYDPNPAPPVRATTRSFGTDEPVGKPVELALEQIEQMLNPPEPSDEYTEEPDAAAE